MKQRYDQPEGQKTREKAAQKENSQSDFPFKKHQKRNVRQTPATADVK